VAQDSTAPIPGHAIRAAKFPACVKNPILRGRLTNSA